MKTFLKGLLVIGLWGATAWADEKKGSAPIDRLADGVYLIGQGTYDQAMEHLLWCWDHGTVADPTFQSVRETILIDAFTVLANNYEPAKQALKARRDTALSQAGSPPKIGPAFFDALILNRALGETAMSEELVQKAVTGGTVKFGSDSEVPAPAAKNFWYKEATPAAFWYKEAIPAAFWYKTGPVQNPMEIRIKTLYTQTKVMNRSAFKSALNVAFKENVAESLAVADATRRIERELKEASSADTKGDTEMKLQGKDPQSMQKRIDALLSVQKGMTAARDAYKEECMYLRQLSDWNDARAKE